MRRVVKGTFKMFERTDDIFEGVMADSTNISRAISTVDGGIQSVSTSRVKSLTKALQYFSLYKSSA